MTKPGGIQPHEHIPTDETKWKVVGFTCAGYDQEDIAKYLRISVDTLQRHYADQIDKAKMEKIDEISGVAYKLAREGNEKMIMFILNMQGKWAAYKRPEASEDKDIQTSLMQKLIDKL